MFHVRSWYHYVYIYYILRTMHTEGNVVRSYTIPWETEYIPSYGIVKFLRVRANRTNSYRTSIRLVRIFAVDLIYHRLWNNLTLLMLLPFILLSLAESIPLSYRIVSRNSPFKAIFRLFKSFLFWGKKG